MNAMENYNLNTRNLLTNENCVDISLLFYADLIVFNIIFNGKFFAFKKMQCQGFNRLRMFLFRISNTRMASLDFYVAKLASSWNFKI